MSDADAVAPLWLRYPLLGTIWKTRVSRFNASERLHRRHWWKNLALALLSVYVLALSVLPKFVTQPLVTVPIDFVGFAPIVASVLVLVFSILVGFDTDAVRSKYLYDNAKRLTDIYHRYKLALIDPTEPVQQVTERTRRQYEKAMARCPFNHDPIDHEQTVLEAEGAKFFAGAWLLAKQFLDVYLWPLIAIAVPPLVAAPAIQAWLSR